MNFQIEFTFSNWILIFCNQPFINFGYLYIIFSTNWIYNFFHFLIGLLLFLIIKWIFFPILKCIFLLFSNWNFFNSMNIYLHFQLHPQTRVSSLKDWKIILPICKETFFHFAIGILFRFLFFSSLFGTILFYSFLFFSIHHFAHSLLSDFFRYFHFW